MQMYNTLVWLALVMANTLCVSLAHHSLVAVLQSTLLAPSSWTTWCPNLHRSPSQLIWSSRICPRHWRAPHPHRGLPCHLLMNSSSSVGWVSCCWSQLNFAGPNKELMRLTFTTTVPVLELLVISLSSFAQLSALVQVLEPKVEPEPQSVDPPLTKRPQMLVISETVSETTKLEGAHPAAMLSEDSESNSLPAVLVKPGTVPMRIHQAPRQ